MSEWRDVSGLQNCSDDHDLDRETDRYTDRQIDRYKHRQTDWRSAWRNTALTEGKPR